MTHEAVGWPSYREALPGVDSIGAGFRAGHGVSVFRTANIHPGAGIHIGDRVMLFDDVRLLLGDGPTTLIIGTDVVVNVGCYLSGEGGLHIGDEVLIGPHVKLLSAGHEIHGGVMEIARNPIVGAPIRILRGAWIGAAAIVLPGVTIGQGAVVGAGSVVSRDVPDMTVVAGVPAKVLYRRGQGRAAAVERSDAPARRGLVARLRRLWSALVR